MKINCVSQDYYEISTRFRETVQQRIERLEDDAAKDENEIARLLHPDHIRRQMRLIAIQRAEAVRMRLFLNRSRTRELES